MRYPTWWKPDWALLAELLLALLLLSYGWFSTFRLVLLLLLASQSLWIRGRRWSDLGLRRPPSVWHAVVQGVVAGGIILVAVRLVIVPLAVAVTGVPLDLSPIEAVRGDPRLLLRLLAQAWTLAAFGEEMVFRGYLIQRIADLAGRSTLGLTVALVVSSISFGWAHRYQGNAGILATALIGALLALLYLRTRNLWPVIVCHAVVDTTALLVIYFGHSSWLYK